MKGFITSAITAGLVILLSSGAAGAQSIGEQEYMNSCAQCHGADGRGDGPMAGYILGEMPDLTQLQSRNAGVFPLTHVYSTIEGSADIGAHGNREMPVWGNRFREIGDSVANPDAIGDQSGVFARFRILALTEYLSTIQEM